MEILEFMEEVSGMTNGRPKASIMFAKGQYNEVTEDYDIVDSLGICKPEITVAPCLDAYENVKFLQVKIKFLSSYDNDLKEFLDFLQRYDFDLKKSIKNGSKIQTFVLGIIPTNIPAIKDDVTFMNLYDPLIFALVASRLNAYPDTIQLLFDAENCYMVEDPNIDLDAVRREVLTEEAEERKNIELEEARQKQMEDQANRMADIQKNLNRDNGPSENVIRVGRGSSSE